MEKNRPGNEKAAGVTDGSSDPTVKQGKSFCMIIIYDQKGKSNAENS